MSDIPDLSAEDHEWIDRVRRDETLRQAIREAIQPKSATEKSSPILSRQSVLLILTAIAFPVITAGLISYANYQISLLRNDFDEVAKLLPDLADDKKDAPMAYDVLTFLIQNDEKSYLWQSQEVSLMNAVDEAALESQNSEVQSLASRKIATEKPPSAPLSVAPPAGFTIVQGSQSQIMAKPEVVYIQYYSGGDKTAYQLKQKLKTQDIFVPSIDNVCNEANLSSLQRQAIVRFAQRGNISVRYFYNADESAAAFTVSILQNSSSASPIVLQNLSGRLQRASPGTVEVWVPLGKGKEEACSDGKDP